MNGTTDGGVIRGEKASEALLQTDVPAPIHSNEDPIQHPVEEEKQEQEQSREYMKGWKLYMLTLG